MLIVTKYFELEFANPWFSIYRHCWRWQGWLGKVVVGVVWDKLSSSQLA